MGLDAAVRLAAIVAVVFLLSGIVGAIVIRKVIGKVISLGMCALIALLFWSQRANIKSCAANATVGDTTCHFLWFDVQVPSPADELTRS
ncbi:MAG: hypothetical protein IT196_04830 [Acidimicrobiales bacterium]|nr:hypothetical protein [Acidimicrobiales bacterium]